ncbi:hypothetical protein V6N12_031127 [Hibiscus sabdariffa]|uniref:Uncharacterized protein n=1 Tax=Hibiscus sabdariffa TaxID=183260 RepID=A0ABR2E805_9ROSI
MLSLWFPSDRPLKHTLSLSSFQTSLKPCSVVVLKEWSSPFERHRQSTRGVCSGREYGRQRAATERRFGRNSHWCDLGLPDYMGFSQEMVRKGISSRTNFWVFQLNPHSYQVVGLWRFQFFWGFSWIMYHGENDQKQVFGYPKNYVNAMRIVDGDIGLEEAYW